MTHYPSTATGTKSDSNTVTFRIKLPRHWKIHASYIAICLVAITAVILIRAYRPTPARPTDPFSSAIAASVQFPLYYPQNPPAGYQIDTKSIKEPQQGVIVFNLVDPGKTTIYMSEEARPESFDLGGFYIHLADLKEVPVSDGAVAVGRIANHKQTEVASRATNKTWILSNTNAPVPFSELIKMMSTLSLNT